MFTFWNGSAWVLEITGQICTGNDSGDGWEKYPKYREKARGLGLVLVVVVFRVSILFEVGESLVTNEIPFASK